MNKKESMRDVLFLAIGECAVSVITVIAALIISAFTSYDFDYTVITGVLFGTAVTVLNFLFLTLSVNSAVDEYLRLRGSRDMSDEEAEKFTAEHSAIIQNKIKTSYLVRTFGILAALVIAFLTKFFNPLATVVPMLTGQFIINLGEIIRRKNDNAPNPDNFIKYDSEEEG